MIRLVSFRLLILGFSLLGSMVLAGGLPSVAHAQIDPLESACGQGTAADASEICRANGGDNPLFGPSGVLTRVANLLSLLVGIVAVLVIIIAGITYSTSSGNPQALSQARSAIIYAGVALAMASLAQVIVRFVLGNVGD